MSAKNHIRRVVLALFTLCIVVAMSACSKKDVIQDEPVMSPTEGMGGTADTMGGTGSSSTGSAGDAGFTATELQTVYYSFDSFSLDSSARDSLKSNADWMTANPSARIQIEGHCDERGTNEYNMALGDKRANAARNYLSKLGVARSRMDIISYGEERPADPGHDEAAWGRNRRAQFVLLSR